MMVYRPKDSRTRSFQASTVNVRKSFYRHASRFASQLPGAAVRNTPPTPAAARIASCGRGRNRLIMCQFLRLNLLSDWAGTQIIPWQNCVIVRRKP